MKGNKGEKEGRFEKQQDLSTNQLERKKAGMSPGG